MAAKKDKKKDKSKKMKVKVKLSTLLIVKVSIGITMGLLIVLLGFGLCVIGFNAEINRVIQKNTTYASTGESSPVFMYVDQETSMKYIYMSWAGSISIGFGTFVVMVGVVYYLERYEHEERSLIAVAAAKEEKIGTEPGKVNFYDIMMAKFRAQRQERGTEGEGEGEAVATEGQAVEGETATEGEKAPEAPAEVKKEETQSTLQPPPHLPPIEPPSSSSEKKRKKSKLFKAPSYHVLSESDLPVPAVQREDSAAKKANIRFHVPPKLPPLQSVLSSSSSDDKLFFSRHEGGSPKSRRRDTLVSNGSTTDSVINLIPGDDKGGNTEST